MTVQLSPRTGDDVVATPRSRAVTILRTERDAIEHARILSAEFAVDAADRAMLGISPAAEAEVLSAAGLLGITVPSDYGGADVHASTTAEVLRLLAAADPHIARIALGHFAAVNVVRLSGTSRQREQIFGEVLVGGLMANAHGEVGELGEPGAVLTPIGSAGFVLDGAARNCVGAPFGDRVAVPTRLNDPHRICGLEAGDYVVLAPVATSGIRIEEGMQRSGHHAAETSIRMDHVQVPREWMVPRAPLLQQSHGFAAFASLLHAAVAVGAARWDVDEVSRFVARTDPLVVPPLADRRTAIDTAQAALRTAGERVDIALAMPHEWTVTEASIAVAAAASLAAGAQLSHSAAS